MVEDERGAWSEPDAAVKTDRSHGGVLQGRTERESRKRRFSSGGQGRGPDTMQGNGVARVAGVARTAQLAVGGTRTAFSLA
eukprot:g10568.t1